ncbi:MAG TPA: M1 family metallopeptidase [Solirubrobacterales bacterium]|jgi:aminopeptidase N
MTGGGFVGRLVAAALAFAAFALIGSATANAKGGHANLHVADLDKPPAPVGPGDEITVTGAVVNRGKSGATAKVRATLGRTPAAKRGSVPLGSTMLSVPPRQTRDFAIDGTVPGWVKPGRYYLSACVSEAHGKGKARGKKGKAKRGGGWRSNCKSHKRPVEVVDAEFTPGSRSLGDELFPQIGNGGYDALHYTIELDYDPVNNVFNPGTATTIQARATQNLSEFSLDFQDLEVTEVTVDGQPAAFEQVLAEPPLPGGGTQPMKLVVTPPEGIPDGEEFLVRVEYEGEPVHFIDPDGSSEGWIPACYREGFTATGPLVCDGAFVVNEPIGAQGWFPSNNFPTDKATFDTHITVPEGKVAFGVGELVSNDPNGDGTVTWKWSEDDPTATYLTTATTGDFTYTERSITETLTGRELPQYEGIDAAATTMQAENINAALARTEEMTNWLADRYGPYPFDSGGAVADAASGVGYALEVQTKPHYAGSFSTGAPSVSQGTLLHEISHQWFGNSVTLKNWNDIWFQEGFAQWSTWAWQYHDGTSTTTPAQQFANNYASGPDTKWNTIPTELNNDPADLFSNFPTYVRGAMTYEGYRQIVGNPRFFDFARELQERFAYGNVSTEDVVDLALEMSGLEGERLELLEEYFQQWLYEGEKPTILPDDFT